MKGSGIYKINNIITNKIYIGSAVDISNRWAVHKYQLRNKLHASKHLQNSWNLYGEDSFKFEIVEYCHKNLFKEREQYWINFYDSCNIYKGYNIVPYARTTLGYRHTEEAKRKISIASKNRKNTGRRNYEKWPHELGSNCKCDECYEKKRNYYKAYDEVRRNV